MSKKKTGKNGNDFLSAHIFGIVDITEKKMVKVSLEETEIDLEMAFQDPNRFYKCKFVISSKI